MLNCHIGTSGGPGTSSRTLITGKATMSVTGSFAWAVRALLPPCGIGRRRPRTPRRRQSAYKGGRIRFKFAGLRVVRPEGLSRTRVRLVRMTTLESTDRPHRAFHVPCWCRGLCI